MQRTSFNISSAPVPPLRAEPRTNQRPDGAGHIAGVEASSGGLIRATLGAAGAAGAILILFWLPAEYGIDPTGVGRLTGLRQMGDIKQQLYAEAAAEDAAAARSTVSAPPAPVVAPELVERLDAMQTQIAAIAAVVGADIALAQPSQPAAAPPAPVTAAAPAPAPTAAQPQSAEPVPVTTTWRDEVSYTLAPTEGIEVKLAMVEGQTAEFEWTANGSELNYDTHGAGGGESVSYDQGRGVPDQAGTLTAAFDGLHGWFWRNRTGAPVTFTLRTRGAYQELVAP